MSLAWNLESLGCAMLKDFLKADGFSKLAAERCRNCRNAAILQVA